MKEITLLFVACLLTRAVPAQICHPQLFMATQDGQCNTDPYVLVFEDDFNGDSLDITKWQIQPWGQGSLVGDNSQQYYSLDNITVANGICSITAKRDTVLRRAVSWLPDDTILSDSLPNLRTYYFTSSSLWTYQKFGNGIFEIRCRIPAGKGFWPAFWTYGSDTAGNSETDVFEFWDDNTVTHHMTVHHDGMMCESDYDGPDYSSAFHTFRVAWDAYKTEWYADNVLKRRLTKYNSLLGQNVDCYGVHANNLYILEKSFPEDSGNIIMNLAIQTGTFAPDSATPFPASLEVDYVRYYRQVPSTGMLSLPDTAVMKPGDTDIIVYPNPNSGVVTIEFREKPVKSYCISVAGMQGGIVYQSPPVKERTITIDLSKLGRGAYVLMVSDDHHQLVGTQTLFIE